MKPFIEIVPEGQILSFEYPKTMQMNITRKCNLSCKHCHVKSSPLRTEDMNEETAKTALRVFKEQNYEIIDITGGSPEMSGVFRMLINEGSKVSKRIMVRSNLTLWDMEEYDYVPEFLRDRNVVIFASLPSPKSLITDRQRGSGTYEKIINNLKTLTSLGYGEKYELNLVHNPNGAFLSANQETLDKEYRQILGEMGIKFTNLFNINNMPLGRFCDFLNNHGMYEEYMEKLYNAYNPATLDNIMCRNMISVDYDGTLYDCDFNLAEGFPVEGDVKTIFELERHPLNPRKIRLFDYCYGCTAGCGSSCGGETA